ncbi:MAG: CHAT domain-containing protein [Saprospiraceae bacterium]|nr:CHAT domain-containing protein [Saprospiraceae bacterium]
MPDITPDAIRELIRYNRLKAALDALATALPEEEQDAVTSLQRRLSQLERAENMRTRSFDDLSIERNSLTEAALQLCRSIGLEKPAAAPVRPAPTTSSTNTGAPESIFSPEGKTKILFVAANPDDAARLQTDREHRLLTAQLERGRERDRFEFLPPQLAVTITELIRAMNGKPNIVHFSGHGGTQGIYITTEDNQAQLMPLAALQRLFKPLAGTVRAVVLNACYSAEQAKVISQYGMYVVGNNLPISDPAAISFSEGFYNGLGEGKDFEAACNDALTVVLTRNPAAADIIEVWKNGERREV